MNIYRLTREEKNALHDEAVQLGLDLFDFEWKEVLEDYGDRLEWSHKPTGYEFHFRGYEVDRRLLYSADWTPVIDGHAGAEFGSNRGALLRAASEWLHVVKREHDTPDLWAAVRQDQELLAGAATEGERPFTTREQELLAERLDQFSAQMKRLTAASTEQAAALDETISTLKAATKTSTRSQWKMTFTGGIFQTILGLALDPVRTREVFQLATTYIGPLIAHVRGLFG